MTELDDPKKVIEEIINPKDVPLIFTLSVSQFKLVYTEIQKTAEGTVTDILLNGEWAMVQFSRLTNHRIRILPDQLPKQLSWVYKKRSIRERDFDFASLYTNFYGDKRPITFLTFLGEEFTSNWLYILLSFFISLIFFSSLYNSIGGKHALEKISEVLLTSATIYLSIFILFTVSQNAEIVKDGYLFKQGLTHRFFRIDRYLATLTVIAMLLCILTIVFINIEQPFKILSITIRGLQLHEYVPFLSSITLTILLNCFISLIRYYFQRVQNIFEKDLTKKLFDELWDKNNPKDD